MRTVPSAHIAIPVKIMGFERSWSYKCPKNNYTAVCVSRTTTNSSINGVLIPLADEASLLELDKRECNYARGKISVSTVISLSSFEVPVDATVWVYETHTELSTNFSSISNQEKNNTHRPSMNCPIPLSYIDVILSGCLSFGREFAREFLVSTKGWCPKSVLNDRNREVRKYSLSYGDNHRVIVDQLLVDVLPLEFKHLARI
jgi:hypothetical protein